MSEAYDEVIQERRAERKKEVKKRANKKQAEKVMSLEERQESRDAIENVEQPLCIDTSGNAPFIAKIEEMIFWKPVNFDDANDIAERSCKYLNMCHENKAKPTFEGLYLALGTNKSTFFAMTNGTIRKSDEVRATLQAVHQAISATYESLAMEGKIHPTMFIFSSKNHMGYKDECEINIQAEEKQTISAEDIKKKYLLLK